MSDSDPIFDHERLECPPDLEYETEQLLPVVVGAHPRAEFNDRPWAGRLVRGMRQWLRDNGEDERTGLLPVVVTDVWYLNDKLLMQQPVVVLGEPGRNAAAAYFATRMPSVYSIDNACQLLMDSELLDVKACLWGVNDESTEAIVKYFETKWLAKFIDAAQLHTDA